MRVSEKQRWHQVCRVCEEDRGASGVGAVFKEKDSFLPQKVGEVYIYMFSVKAKCLFLFLFLMIPPLMDYYLGLAASHWL